MSTTALRLPDELKRRAADAAQQQGLSPHAFMVRAIEQAVTAAELRASFLANAQCAREATLRTGKGYDAEDVHAYLQGRLAGKKSARPKARPWRG